MKIDSHHHIWDLSVRDQDWIVGDALAPIKRNFLMADLRSACRESGIEKTVLVQTVTKYDETPELLELANNDEMVAGVVGWLDISSASAISHLDEYQSLTGAIYLKGIRDIVQDHPDSDYLARPQVDKNVKELGKRDLAFDILTKTPELPGAIELVKNNPDVQFVLDHISKPYISKGEFEPWASLIGKIANFENVVCKVSGIITEANWKDWKREEILPYFEIILENFGSDRLMYGSDWPVCTLAGSYSQVFELAKWLTAQFSVGESNSFWGGCANRAYRLGFDND
jgi:L-fuconolactonase